MRSAAVSALAALFLFACSDDSSSGSGGAGAAAAGGAGGVGGGFQSGTGGSAPLCADNVRPIFVLVQTTPPVIYSFDPFTLTFAPVQPVECPNTDGWAVSSMAVDREYHAWIEWGAPATGPTDPYVKRLDRLDLATGACEPGYAETPMVEEWGSPLGMAFVSDSNGSSAEHLYFADPSTRTYPIAGGGPLGPYYVFKPGEGTTFSGVELTGTGAGRLFMMIMNWTPEWSHPCTANDPCLPTVHIGEVDKASGSAITNEEVIDIPAFGISPGGFAFAHWGGKLWVFESPDFGPTKVYSYDPETGATALEKSDGPDAVVGAGVSTCAPLEVPM